MEDRKGKILVVDDVEINRIILDEMLNDTYEITQAGDGFEALSLIYNASMMPDLILLDVMMPEISGFDVLAILKNNPLTNKLPVIFITAANESENEVKGLLAGASDYIVKPFVPEVVKLRVSNFMELIRYRTSLEEQVEIKVNELTMVKDHMLETMAAIIEYRNLESGGHVKRTMALSNIMVNHMLTKPDYIKKLTDLDYKIMIKASPMHDIGKIAIPDSILLKPAKLTDEEYEIIKTHTTVGGQIIESMMEYNHDTYFTHCHDISLYHHERWDGRGYPKRLVGEDIPLSARIVSIVDVYDALVSERIYKKALSHEEAMKILLEGRGTQFDPNLINILTEIQGEFETCHSKYS